MNKARSVTLRAPERLKERRAAWSRYYYALIALCICTLLIQERRSDGAVANGIAHGSHAFAAPVLRSGSLFEQVRSDSKEKDLFRGWARALGGEERLRRIENTYIRGRIETGGLSGTFEEWRIAKGQHKQKIELGEVSKQLTIFDGHNAWILDQNGSFQELTGTDLENEVTAAYLGSLSYLIPGRMPGRAEYLGEDDTKQNYMLKIWPQGGRPVTFYIDKTTYLPLKIERREAERIRTTHFSDWRDVDGLKFPYQLRQTVGDPSYDIVLTIQEVRLNLPISSGEFEKPQKSTTEFHFVSGRAALGIPFELGGSNHIFIQARVNGSGPFCFILDTGAATSMIDQRLARRLGLNVEGKIEGRTSGDNSFDVGFVKNVSFVLPGVELIHQAIGTVQLGPSEPLLGRAIAGLLGYDFISRFVVEIDYATKRINLYDPINYQYRGRGESFPMMVDGNLPFMRARIMLTGRNAIEGRFLIDTGTSYFLEVNRSFIERNQISAEIHSAIPSVSSATSQDEAEERMVRARQLQVGRFIINDPVIRLSRATSGVQANPDQDGIMGGELLRRFTLILNYSRHQLILEPNANLMKPVEYNMSGADIVADGPAFQIFRVRAILANSPAAEAGLHEGDIITAIDGRPATEFTLDQIIIMLKQAGTTHTVTILRGGTILQVQLKPRRSI